MVYGTHLLQQAYYGVSRYTTARFRSYPRCEVERKNRKLRRAGKLLIEPIYTVEDALESMKQFRYLQLDEIIELAPLVR